MLFSVDFSCSPTAELTEMGQLLTARAVRFHAQKQPKILACSACYRIWFHSCVSAAEIGSLKKKKKKSQFAKNVPLCSSLSMYCSRQYRSIHDSVHFPHPLHAPLFCWAAGVSELHLQIKCVENALGSMTGETETES